MEGGGVVDRTGTVDGGEEGGCEEEEEEDGERGVDEAPGVGVGDDGVVTSPPPPVDGAAEDMMTANERKKRKERRIWGMMGLGERKKGAKRRQVDGENEAGKEKERARSGKLRPFVNQNTTEWHPITNTAGKQHSLVDISVHKWQWWT